MEELEKEVLTRMSRDLNGFASCIKLVKSAQQRGFL